MINLPPIPTDVKHIAHFLKVADEHDERNVVISYWCRMYACQVAMKSIPGKKPPEVTTLLIAIMDWLEQSKKAHPDSDGITNETAAQALIEEYAIQLFQYADGQDQAENFGKNVVKAFYTAGILMDVLQQFGTLSEDIFSKRKYAKWKAAYIHNCLKNGEKPLPGPPTERNLLGDSDEDEDEDEATPGPTPRDSGAPGPINPSIPPAQPFLPNVPVGPDQGNFPFIPQPTFTPEPAAPQPAPVPQPAPRVNPVSPAAPPSSVSIGPEHIEKAQKYIKWAQSALNYDDVKSAIENLQKSVHLLQFGRDE